MLGARRPGVNDVPAMCRVRNRGHENGTGVRRGVRLPATGRAGARSVFCNSTAPDVPDPSSQGTAMVAHDESFDRLFHALLTSPPEPATSAPGGRGKGPSAPDLEARIRKGLGLFHRGEYDPCAEALGRLQQEAAGDPRVEAFLAASRALSSGEAGAGLRACVVALRGGAYTPDVCCALGSLLLHEGDRARAHAVFRKGLAAEPTHPYLRVKLRAMGLRRPPVVRCLPRSHGVNRLLGFLRARLTSA